MIKINKITPLTVNIYDPSGKLIGKVNEYEFLDFRVQIKNAQVFGYYLIFKNEKIVIDKNGELEKYPIGLFDMLTDFYCQLI